jgi:hypothetical protein
MYMCNAKREASGYEWTLHAQHGQQLSTSRAASCVVILFRFNT